VAIDPSFWRDRRVFLTGHTGFKGSWMLCVLEALGAKVTGYALDPPTDPSLFALLGLERACSHVVGDIRDLPALEAAMTHAAPDVVIHMAAQALVRDSYRLPVETYAINVMGTVHVMDVCRRLPSVRSAVMVTTDKCYENVGWAWGYRENDRLGGHDPYSNSKAAAELAVSAYRDSFFAENSVHLASARAGNVIGGGDFATDRLAPDAMQAFMAGEPLMVRNPLAVRPWQHVLEPVVGYLLLAQRLYADAALAAGWNFGPSTEQNASVGTIASELASLWGDGAGWLQDPAEHPHEAHTLKLDSTKARIELGWAPRLSLIEALQLTVDWYKAHHRGDDLRALCERQVLQFLG
jgi:CDP-glucose 4,6-dehydratase